LNFVNISKYQASTSFNTFSVNIVLIANFSHIMIINIQANFKSKKKVLFVNSNIAKTIAAIKE
jgi:hypothetical protein